VLLSKGSKYAMILNPSLFKNSKISMGVINLFQNGRCFFLVCVLNENFALFYLENERIFGVFFVIF